CTHDRPDTLAPDARPDRVPVRWRKLLRDGRGGHARPRSLPAPRALARIAEECNARRSWLGEPGSEICRGLCRIDRCEALAHAARSPLADGRASSFSAARHT